jgi:hypothetical protein
MTDDDGIAYTLRFPAKKESSHEEVSHFVGLVIDAAGVGGG